MYKITQNDINEMRNLGLLRGKAGFTDGVTMLEHRKTKGPRRPGQPLKIDLNIKPKTETFKKSQPQQSNAIMGNKKIVKPKILCTECQRETSKELDAYYGRTPGADKVCAPCRKKKFNE